MLDKMRDNAQSWGIKLLFGIIILAFVFAFGSPQDTGQTVMAYVNGEPIGVDDFQRQLPRTANQNPDIKRNVLFQMVNVQLMEQAARESGITVSDAELVRAINGNPQFQNNGVFDMERYKAIVGNKPEAFEESERVNLLLGKVNRFASLPARPTEAEVRSLFRWQNEQAVVEYAVVDPGAFFETVQVHDDEAQSFYEQNQQRFTQPAKVDFEYVAFTPAALAPGQDVTDEEIKTYYDEASLTLVREKRFVFRHILLPVGENPTQEDINAIQEQVAEIQQRIASGSDFAEVALLYGQEGAGDPIAMTPGEMPEELARALSTLDKGGISQPVITKAGLNLVQLVDIEEPKPMTLDEARPIIRERLAQEKAARILGDRLEETIAQMNQGVELARIAENLGLAVKETGPMTREQLVEEFGLNAEAADTLVTLMNGTTTKTPLRIGNGGYLVAKKIDELPEVVMPIESVREEIDVEIKRVKARELALEEAQAVLVEGSKGEGELLERYSAQLTATQPFARAGQIEGLQVDPQMTKDAFTVQPGQWLPSPYASTGGYVVARLKQTTPAPDALWEEQKLAWEQAAVEIYRREIYQAMNNSMFQRANNNGAIELVRPDLLN